MKLLQKLLPKRDKVLGLTPRRRVGLALTGAIAGLALCGGMLPLFAQLSSSPWLPNSPEAVAQVEACRQQQPQPAAREVCVRQVVAQWRAAKRSQPVVAPTP